MTIILTHGDGDGICSAALVKMTKEFKEAEVRFTHPMGFADDLRGIEEEVVICDIAIDERAYETVCKELNYLATHFSVLYIDHHRLPGKLPQKVSLVHQEYVSATELVFRHFYYQLPKTADRIAVIGAICDYLDHTPLMMELRNRFERRTLFLDAGLLAQGLKNGNSYDEMRNLVLEFSNGLYPCENKKLVDTALNTTRKDKDARLKVIKLYNKGKKIAWIINPPASKSKAAHWVMGDSGSIIGLTVRFHSTKAEIADITIRGRNLIDLRTIIPKIALNLGGSGIGHANAIGCRIPREKTDQFLKIVDTTIDALGVESPPHIEGLIPIESDNEGWVDASGKKLE
jgi:RecJ-like exonuclease